MKKRLPKTELQYILQSEAAEIIASREKSFLIHHTKDIRAAGDEVEITVRDVLKKKLPNNYYIGGGHIVDQDLTTSPQLDVIITDSTKITSLFKTQNNTEYFTYESVYGYGEIKSTYYKNLNYIESFIQTNKKIQDELKREKTPTNQLTDNIKLGSGMTVDLDIPYRNPLMSFMLFVNSGDFDFKDIVDIYLKTEVDFLPNIICLLDKGCIINAQIINNEKLGSINPTPIFIKEDKKTTCKWVFIPFGDEEHRIGSNFGVLYYLIVHHLTSTLLLKPDLLKYMKHMFNHAPGEILD